MKFRLRNLACLSRLEIALVVAVLLLVCQLFPSITVGLLRIVDVRYWPRTIWMALSVLGLLTMLAFRFAPQFYEDWRSRRLKSAAKQEKRNQQLAAKAERERLEAIRRSRSRRMY